MSERPYSTRIQLAEFKDSLIWGDMKYELEEALSQCEKQFASCEGLQALGDLQGGVKALRFALSLPDVLLLEAEEKDPEEGGNITPTDDPPGTEDMQ